MIIKCLIENNRISNEIYSEHGLSLFIDDGFNKYLFDTGQSNNFIENAKLMGVRLEDIEYTIISHGHYDHGGGLLNFLKINSKSKIFIHRKSFGKKFNIKQDTRKEIGLDKNLLNFKNRFTFVDNSIDINKNASLFTNYSHGFQPPKGNSTLFKETSKGIVNDDFKHEINLNIQNKGFNYLFTGCSHNGILNIITSHYNKYSKKINYLFGGFHLKNLDITKNHQYLDTLSYNLNKFNIDKIYTCHCTGIDKYKYLSKKTNNLSYLHSGESLKFN